MNRSHISPAVLHQLAPAEELQTDVAELAPFISPRFGLGLLALTAVLAGTHWAWSMTL